jgi:hypothetical protein
MADEYRQRPTRILEAGWHPFRSKGPRPSTQNISVPSGGLNGEGFASGKDEMSASLKVAVSCIAGNAQPLDAGSIFADLRAPH